jgi:hypothetical protein
MLKGRELSSHSKHRVADNVLALGEEADFEAQNYQHSTKFDR